MRAKILKLLFFAMLTVGIYASFCPGTRTNLLGNPPRWLNVWVSNNDDLINIAAFFVLAFVAFRLDRLHFVRLEKFAHGVVRLLPGRAFVMVALMLLVCVIEAVQTFIPGRVGELQDVCTAWSGIFAAWLLCVFLDAGTNVTRS